MSTTTLADRLILTPKDIDLSRSPLAGRLAAETYVLGAFNPGLTRMPDGRLLMMVRIAQALRDPVVGDTVRSIRWAGGAYHLDAWPLSAVDVRDPRAFSLTDRPWRTLALTSLSWLLPVILSSDGSRIEEIDYGRAIVPQADHQCYGIEDPRISRVDGRYYMTTCSVSPERHSTTLYVSDDAVNWLYEGIVLDHQNKDMLIFEGKVGGKFWAQTRPLGDLYFAYPPGSPFTPGPSINLASSPDGLHWKPCDRPGLRPLAVSGVSARMGGGAPPVLSDEGWLCLWHGVEANGGVGTYRTYLAVLDRDDPSIVLRRSDPDPVLSPNPALTAPIDHLMYLRDVVFTTGIADDGDAWLIASGEADLACRITRIAKGALRE